MVGDLVTALPLIIGISVVTAAIVYWRAEELAAATPQPAPARSWTATRNRLTSGYLGSSLVFGPVAVAVYRWMEGTSPTDAAAIYLKVGAGAALVLSLLAVVGLPRMRRRGVPEYIALNLLWGIGYGWFLPQAIG